LGEVIGAAKSLAEAEISEFEVVGFKEDVVGLDIPVQDEILMEGAHGGDELFEDAKRLFFG
jgi:hypothetical protein